MGKVQAIKSAAPAGGVAMQQDEVEALGRFIESKDKMNAAFVERAAPIMGLHVARLTGDNVFLIGPPGTAKTALCRAFANATAAGSFFDVTLTKFSTPEEIFGPLSFQGIKQDRYERIMDGFAPRCRVVNLDEVFKGSSAIMNATLRLMNEHTVAQNGRQIQADTEMVIGASNEYPSDDTLNAFFDRFVLRYWVDYIGDSDLLFSMIEGGDPSNIPEMVEIEHVDAMRNVLDRMGRDAGTAAQLRGTLQAVKKATEAEGFRASDRTWKRCRRIVLARALLAGRTAVHSGDYLILADVLWNRHGDRDRLFAVIGNAADPYGSRAVAVMDAVKTALRELPELAAVKRGQLTKTAAIAKIAEVQAAVASRRDALAEVVDAAGGAASDRIGEAQRAIEEAQKVVDDTMRAIVMHREVK